MSLWRRKGEPLLSPSRRRTATTYLSRLPGCQGLEELGAGISHWGPWPWQFFGRGSTADVLLRGNNLACPSHAASWPKKKVQKLLVSGQSKPKNVEMFKSLPNIQYIRTLNRMSVASQGSLPSKASTSTYLPSTCLPHVLASGQGPEVGRGLYKVS